MENIIIRPLTQIVEFDQAVQVQSKAWNRNEYSLIPPTMFKSFSKNGGSVIGAIVQNESGIEEVIGYVLGFTAITKQGKLYHHSQQVAVLPEYQQLGIASKLKLAQKEYVQESFGITIMSWTVDPLLSKNAFLNYHKLGAIGRIYWLNYYGQRTDNLNKGLETDRIEVEWFFDKTTTNEISRVKQEIPDNFLIIDYTETGSYQQLSIENQSYIGIAIPRDLVVLKEQNLSLAQELRREFRKIALFLIEKGFCIIDIKSKVEPKSFLIWTNKLQKLEKIK